VLIHVVTLHNQHLYGRQLDEMFRMRHEFYVKQRGWSDLTSSNGRETDEFDNEHAVYLMNLDRHGRILATFRLNPTNTPYLLGDKLPHYLSGEAPRRDDVWDLTRWMVATNARRKGAGEIANAQKYLLCGVMEFAVSRGLTALTCLMDTVFLDRMAAVWPVKKLGEPQRFEDGNGEAIAVEIESGPHILAQTRLRTGVYDPVLFELETQPPTSETEHTKRQTAIEKEMTMSPADLDRVREAASHLVRELKSVGGRNPEDSIKAIDAFTRFLKGTADERAFQNA
tara:strand:- start:28559 stop:29407 length:849 start_codon:yes stop_codon:yes gene_type:complete